MHYVIGILIAAASLVYWLGMASRGAREVSNLAHDVKNRPRRRKFQKKAAQMALELVDDPVEAATIIMIAIARAKGDLRVSQAEANKITNLLASNMQLTPDYAEDMLIQSRAMTSQIVLQDTLLMAMIDVLRGRINADDAAGLATMMGEVAMVDGPVNADQSEMIRKFKERMGLSH